MSLDSLCRWQVQVSVYCAWRIPAHLRCTLCSILLHLMDICFLTCICLWQISQIQTFLFKVVGPGLVSTSPAFVSSSASHPAGPHGRHAQGVGLSLYMFGSFHSCTYTSSDFRRGNSREQILVLYVCWLETFSNGSTCLIQFWI